MPLNLRAALTVAFSISLFNRLELIATLTRKISVQVKFLIAAMDVFDEYAIFVEALIALSAYLSVFIPRLEAVPAGSVIGFCEAPSICLIKHCLCGAATLHKGR